MATNAQIIRDALGLIGVLNEIENATAEQGTHALRIFNEMLEEWQADGVRVGQWPQQDINAECPLGTSTLPAVKYNLAAMLAPYYGTVLTPPDMARAERYYARLLREAVGQELTTADMTHLPGSLGGRWNITTDS